MPGNPIAINAVFSAPLAIALTNAYLSRAGTGSEAVLGVFLLSMSLMWQ